MVPPLGKDVRFSGGKTCARMDREGPRACRPSLVQRPFLPLLSWDTSFPRTLHAVDLNAYAWRLWQGGLYFEYFTVGLIVINVLAFILT